MVFKFACCVEFTIGYQPVKFQRCTLSWLNFAEGLEKHNDDFIMTSFDMFEIPNLHIL